MLLKHVYMGWKFQRTLKLNISFSPEHFFISVAIFTQVASAPLKHKKFKENLFKVHNYHTVDEKTSNEYSDDQLINFNLVCAATNASNLSSINKNNSNACDITNAYEGKTVEAILANSVPISAPDK